MRPDLGLFAVADGMGGHAAGDVAAQTALAALLDALPGQPLDTAVAAANRAVFDRAQAEPDKLGMGTTLTVVQLAGESEFLCAHVGDSRLYRLRNAELQQLTRDHSIPRTSMLTRAVGTQADVEIDIFRASLTPHDRFLLCSDGLTNMVADEDLRTLLAQDKPLDGICRDLVDAANRNGGIDNITVIVIEIS